MNLIIDHPYYTLGILGLILFLLVRMVIKNEKEEQIKKEANKKAKVKPEPVKDKEPIKEIEPEILKEVIDFDESDYISDTFNTVFHSLQIENWSTEHGYSSISFSKRKVDNQNQNRRTTQIKLIVEFSFEYIKGSKGHGILDREFSISKITLHPPDGNNVFTFKGELKPEHKKYFYDVYAKNKSDVNASKKEKIDISLKSINEMVGQASIRDSKLSELLGN